MPKTLREMLKERGAPAQMVDTLCDIFDVNRMFNSALNNRLKTRLNHADPYELAYLEWWKRIRPQAQNS